LNSPETIVINIAMEKEKKYLLLNWILLTGYGCINLFALYSSAYSWPTQGSVIWFLLIIFCPPFLYHLVFIAYELILKKRLHWKKSYRFITLLCGVLLAGGLLQLTQKISLTRFKTAYSPLVAQVQQKMPLPCDSHYFEIRAVNRYNHSVTQKPFNQGKPSAALLYNPQRFVLYFRGGSVDMDNSTLYYDSETQSWSFFHNDDAVMTESFDTRTKGLIKCPDF
jgi:hypothetical protein